MKITSINLSKINKAVTGITESVRRSKVIIDGISEKVNKSNENIKNRISDATKLFQMRRQAARRKEREDLVEASGIGGAIKRTNKIVSSSTRGFLGRILDFIGTILIGWAVVNIPKIVALAKNLFKRMQKFFKVITGFTEGLREFYTKFTTELSAIISNLSQIDLQPVSDQISNIILRLQNAFKRMENGFIREIFAFNRMTEKDLINYFNIDLSEEERELIEEEIEEEIGEEQFENLPKNIQEAIKLYISQTDNKTLDEYDKRDILSGDIKTIEAMLRDKNIVPFTNDDGEIEYKMRREEEDVNMIENIKNLLKNLFKGQEAKAGTLEEFEAEIAKLKKERNLVSDDAASNTIIYRRKNKRRNQRDQKVGSETNLNFASVNSNEKNITDTLITKIQY